MQITVAICTWNRARLLDQTLASLRGLSVPRELSWECLVVNNNCTDNSADVVEKHADKLPLRMVVEAEQGLSQSRNRAIREARGELIVFADDDVLVEPQWLTAYGQAAQRWPDAGYFAGAVFPWYEVPPRPHVANVLNELANGAFLGVNLGDEERIMSAPRDSLRGANMAVRRKVAITQDFDPAFGRTADKVWFGDEWDYCQRLRQLGFYGVWVPHASLRHFVPVARVEDAYLQGFFRGLGTSMVRLGHIAYRKKIAAVPPWVLAAYARTCFGKYLHWLSGDQVAYYRGLTQQWRFEGILQEFWRVRNGR